MPQFSISLAPQQLMQAINPWTFTSPQFGLINISLGQSSSPETEHNILDKVGSYGRQLGRVGDALEVLVRHFDTADLAPQERDALTILLGQLAEIRSIKTDQVSAEAKAASVGGKARLSASP